jgi:uncharacterized protein (DUF58 family)
MTALLIIVGLATGRSVLFVVAACLITVIPVAWLWRGWSLRGVEYERSFDTLRAFPDETVALTVRISNRKPLPVSWLEALDEVPLALPLVRGELLATHDPNTGLIRNVLALKWYERALRRYELRCTARGWYCLGPVRLRSGDLFTLFETEREIEGSTPLVVYPRIWPLEELGLPAKDPFGEYAAHRRLLDDPLRTVGVRDYHPEDGLRRVHWKATAHRGQLQVRVYEPASTPTIAIALNVATFEHHWQGVLPELFERAISVAASLATWAAGRKYKVGLLANGCVPRSDQPVRVPPGRSPGQLATILEALAAVTSFASTSIGGLLRRESRRLPWGATLVVVTAIVTDDLTTALGRLRDAGRPVGLVTVAKEEPPSVGGVATYHLPPDRAVFGRRGQGADDAAAALAAAGLASHRFSVNGRAESAGASAATHHPAGRGGAE